MITDPKAPQPDAELTALVAAECERLSVPGCAVGVIAGGRSYAAAHGVTDVRHPRAVDEDTLFPIGSTTKTFTATTLMSLVQEGLVSLDDPVVKHLPELELSDRSARDAVTVGQLFDHTAGWRGDVEASTGWGDDALGRALREFVAVAPQIYRPGWTASYNNLALVVAGRLIEQLTSGTYEAAVQTRLLDPLGMSDTFLLPWDAALRPLAAGHVLHDGVAQPVYGWQMPRALGPAGGAVSTVCDQLRYAAFHLDGSAADAPPLRDDLRLLMQKPRVTLPAALSGIGVSWLLEDRDGLGLVTHGGNCNNVFLSAFVLAPSERFAVTVLTNSRGGSPLGRVVTEWAIQHYLGRGAVPTPTVLPLTPDLAPDYIGRYDAGEWDQEITVVEDRLFTQLHLTDVAPDTSEEVLATFRAPPTELVLVGPDVVAPAASPEQSAGDFVRGADGNVEFFRYGLRLARRRP